MVQNRNKLIDLFIGNTSNSIVHSILENAIDDVDISKRYDKEIGISINIAKKYRDRINPKNIPLPVKDVQNIRCKIINKVRSELMLRISRGYENIDLESIEKVVNKALEDLNVI